MSAAQDIITASLAEALKGMDDRGMFPPHPCKRCGKMLNADGGHPAELYAGTYTGLCYECERGPAFVVSVSSLDGAQIVSHPPHCPAWRRSREEFTSYPDCPDCKGAGMKIVSRDYSQGGPYPSYCATCSKRYHGHPIRRWWKSRHDAIYRACDHDYQRAARAYAKKFHLDLRRRGKHDPWANMDDAVWREEQFIIYMGNYSRLLKVFNAQCERRGIGAGEFKSVEGMHKDWDGMWRPNGTEPPAK